MAGHRGAGELQLAHGGGDGGVELHLAVHLQLGMGGLDLGSGVGHLGHRVALAAALGGVAQHGHLGVDAEVSGGLGGLHGGLHQGVLIGIDLNGAVAHGQALFHHVLLPDQDEAGADVLVAGLGLDQLEGGAHGVGGGVGGAAQQGVGNPHLHQHGAEVVALLQVGPDGVHVHLALAELIHLLGHGVHIGIIFGVHDLRPVDTETALGGGGLHGLHIAHQHRLQEVAGLDQPVGGGQDTGIGALGEHNLLRVLLQGFDQSFKQIHVFCLHDFDPARGRSQY